MQINEVIEVLRKSLKDISFDDIPNKLPTIDFAQATGIDYKMNVLSCRVISDEVLDIDLRTGDFPTSIDYTITLRKIVNYYPIPLNYITINKDTTMADNVEVYVGDLSGLIQTDIITLENGEYACDIPVAPYDIDFDRLYDSLGNYSLYDLIDSIMDTIKDSETRVRALHNIKEFYDYESVNKE